MVEAVVEAMAAPARTGDGPCFQAENRDSAYDDAGERHSEASTPGAATPGREPGGRSEPACPLPQAAVNPAVHMGSRLRGRATP